MPRERVAAHHFEITIHRTDDGRWVALHEGVPYLKLHGDTREEAIAGAQGFVLRTLVQRVESGHEVEGDSLSVSIEVR